MNLKSWIIALLIAGSTVVGTGYVYNKGAIETELQSENLGLSEGSIGLDDVGSFLDGIKNAARQLKDGIGNIIDEYIDKN